MGGGRLGAQALSVALTLFVPGLCAGYSAGRAVDANLPAAHTPALLRLLAQSDRAVQPVLPLEARLADLFGVADQTLPWGALGLWGERGERPQDFVLRLDPVHLKLGMSDAIVFGGVPLHLRMDEAQELARALEAHFAERGWRIDVPAAERWYLRLTEASELECTPLSQAIGRDAGLFKPQGRDARRWLADLTEAQMVLFAHPLNQAREARGLPIINSLWPWGAGSLSANELTRSWREPAPTGQGHGQVSMDLPPSPPAGEGLGERGMNFATERSAQIPKPPLPSPPPRGGRELFPPAQFTAIHANSPLARGLAYAQGLPVHDLAETLDECAELSGNALIVLDDLLQPLQDGDFDDWQATLEGLEARWFAPLRTALARGRIVQLTLDASGAARFMCKPAQRWRVWRRDLSLEQQCAASV